MLKGSEGKLAFTDQCDLGRCWDAYLLDKLQCFSILLGENQHMDSEQKITCGM